MSGLVVRMIVVAAGVLNVHDDGRVSRDGRDAPKNFWGRYGFPTYPVGTVAST